MLLVLDEDEPELLEELAAFGETAGTQAQRSTRELRQHEKMESTLLFAPVEGFASKPAATS